MIYQVPLSGAQRVVVFDSSTGFYCTPLTGTYFESRASMQSVAHTLNYHGMPATITGHHVGVPIFCKDAVFEPPVVP